MLVNYQNVPYLGLFTEAYLNPFRSAYMARKTRSARIRHLLEHARWICLVFVKLWRR